MADEIKVYGTDPECLESDRKEILKMTEDMKFKLDRLIPALEKVDPRGNDLEFYIKLVIHAIDLLDKNIYDSFDTEIRDREHTATA